MFPLRVVDRLLAFAAGSRSFLIAGSWERLPAAIVEFCEQKLHRMDAGHEFMGR
jgi:hypothetical protein